jgi:hypothetical protein
VGRDDTALDGAVVGLDEGLGVGVLVGATVGPGDGGKDWPRGVGAELEGVPLDGERVGELDGEETDGKGVFEGEIDGLELGVEDGPTLDFRVGEIVGVTDGLKLGALVELPLILIPLA